jgi:outer membrane protein assembly factor BamB
VHPSSAAAAVDLDGDGRRELLCGTVYYWWHCAASDGTKRWSHSVTGPHATVALGVNFRSGKGRAAVFGAEDGNLHVLDAQGNPKDRYQADAAVLAIVPATAAKDGPKQTVLRLADGRLVEVGQGD